MIRFAKRTFREEINAIGVVGRTSRIQLLRWTKHESALEVGIRVGSRLCGSKAAITIDWVVCRIGCYRCGTRSCGLFGMLETVCVCAQPPRNGMSWGNTRRAASSPVLGSTP